MIASSAVPASLTCHPPRLARGEWTDNDIREKVVAPYAALLHCIVTGPAAGEPHPIVWPKFIRALGPHLERGATATLWHRAARIIAETRFKALLPINPRVTARETNHHAPVEPRGAARSPQVPEVKQKGLKEERDGARFSVTCTWCGHLQYTFTETRAIVERDQHAADHREDLSLGWAHETSPRPDRTNTASPAPPRPVRAPLPHPLPVLDLTARIERSRRLVAAKQYLACRPQFRLGVATCLAIHLRARVSPALGVIIDALRRVERRPIAWASYRTLPPSCGDNFPSIQVARMVAIFRTEAGRQHVPVINHQASHFLSNENVSRTSLLGPEQIHCNE